MNDSPAVLVASLDLCSNLSLAFSYFFICIRSLFFISLEQFISQTWRLLGILRFLSWWYFLSVYQFYIILNINLFIYSQRRSSSAFAKIFCGQRRRVCAGGQTRESWRCHTTRRRHTCQENTWSTSAATIQLAVEHPRRRAWRKGPKNWFYGSTSDL